MNSWHKAVQAAVQSADRSIHAAIAARDPAWSKWHRRHCLLCFPWAWPPPLAGKYKPGPKAARMFGGR